MDNNNKDNNKTCQDNAALPRSLHLKCGNSEALEKWIQDNYNNKKEDTTMQLQSPRAKYQSSENLDLDIALQVKRAEISRLLDEVTALEGEVQKICDQLLKSIRDESWLLDMQTKRQVRDRSVKD